MEHCEQKRRTIRRSAPRWLVSPASGSMLPGSPLAASCSGPVARNGFLLARNSCRLSATSIPGSKLLACYFASFQVASVPVRPFGSTTAFRIAPVAAASLPGARCTSTTRFGLPRLPSPLPSGTFASLGIKAFNRVCCLPVHLTNPPDFLSLPAARPGESWGVGSSFQVRYVSAGLLFLKPLGTFFTMLPIGFFVNAYSVRIHPFSSAFISLVFSVLQRFSCLCPVYKTFSEHPDLRYCNQKCADLSFGRGRSET